MGREQAVGGRGGCRRIDQKGRGGEWKEKLSEYVLLISLKKGKDGTDSFSRRKGEGKKKEVIQGEGKKLGPFPRGRPGKEEGGKKEVVSPPSRKEGKKSDQGRNFSPVKKETGGEHLLTSEGGPSQEGGRVGYCPMQLQSVREKKGKRKRPPGRRMKILAHLGQTVVRDR